MNTDPGRLRRLRAARAALGFTLVELMITVAIVSIIAAIAYPNYGQYVVRASRQAAQTQLVQLTALQEKIFLNSNAYAGSVTAAYNGTSTGGLGIADGKTTDGKYTISVAPTTPGQSFTLTATPVATLSQKNDGTITINSSGAKTWGSATW